MSESAPGGRQHPGVNRPHLSRRAHPAGSLESQWYRNQHLLRSMLLPRRLFQPERTSYHNHKQSGLSIWFWHTTPTYYQRHRAPWDWAPPGKGAGLVARTLPESKLVCSPRSTQLVSKYVAEDSSQKSSTTSISTTNTNNSRPTPPRAAPVLPPLHSSLSLWSEARFNGDDSDDGNTFLAGHVVTGLLRTQVFNFKQQRAIARQTRRKDLRLRICQLSAFKVAHRPTTSCTSLTYRSPVLRPRSHHRFHLGARSPVLCPRCHHPRHRHVVDVALAR